MFSGFRRKNPQGIDLCVSSIWTVSVTTGFFSAAPSYTNKSASTSRNVVTSEKENWHGPARQPYSPHQKWG